MGDEYLLATSGPAAGCRLAIDCELVIGRATLDVPGLDTDTELSRRHARVFRGEGGQLVIADLGSSNGTFRNGQRISAEQPLRHGDELRLGHSVFRLEAEGASGLEPAPRRDDSGSDFVYVPTDVRPPPPDGAGGSLGTGMLLSGGKRLRIEPAGMTIGRDPESSLVLDNGLVSRRHARIDLDARGYYVTDLGSANGVYLNGERLQDESRWLSNGDSLVIGDETIRFVLGEETALAVSGVAAPGSAGEPRRIGPVGDRLTLGRDTRNDVALDDPNVSRFHAEVVRVDGGYELRDLSSKNGTRLNGQLTARARITTGSEIGIGPFRLVFDGSAFVERDERGALRLDAYDIEVRAGGQTILEPTTLSILPGQFVVIIGEAGSGKSTLVKALGGVSPASKGLVVVNGESVMVRLAEIGYVPQFDIVHQSLTAREALTYAASLRLPLDTDRTEIRQAVDQVLEELELQREEDPDSKNQKPIEDRLVLSLSGGQRKRVSVGTELVSRPGLMFLDEPTSGLDPRLERIMMENMRHLADQGRAVVTITHATGNLRLADRVLVMGRGGVLCFDGAPPDALAFFGVKGYEGIYDALAQRSAREWQSEWKRRHGDRVSAEAVLSADGSAAGIPTAPTRDEIRAHARTLIARTLRLLFRDSRNLLVLLGAGPVLALLLLVMFDNPNALQPGHNPLKASQLLFFVLTVVLFLGTTAAAREIVKDRPVFTRESAVGVSVEAYVLSKAAVLFGLALVQALAVSAIVFGQRPGAANAGVLAIVVLTGFIGVVIGLAISALARNESQATSLIPLALLPQIMFCGLIVPAKDLPQALSALVFERWSLQGVLNAADFDSRFQKLPEKDNPFGMDFLQLSWPVSLVILVGVVLSLLALVAWWLGRQTPAGSGVGKRA